jgi:primary-amine oxidase
MDVGHKPNSLVGMHSFLGRTVGCAILILLLLSAIQDVGCIPTEPDVAQKAARGRGRRTATLRALKAQLEPRDPRQYGTPPEAGFPTPQAPASNGPCPEKFAKSFQALRNNIWLGLTGPEIASVVSWLFEQQDLNLTTSKEAEQWDNKM